MSLFLELIHDAIKERCFLEIYREYLHYDTLGASRPIQVSSDLLIVETYDREMRFDGFSVIKLEDISQIQRRDRKLRIMNKLAAPTEHRIFPELNCSSFPALLKDLRIRQQFLAFYRENHGDGPATGIVKEYDSSHILFDWYGTVATLDRLEGLVPLEDITRIELESPFAQRIFELHKKNKESGGEKL